LDEKKSPSLSAILIAMGHRIRELREMRSLTQSEIAARVEMTVSNYKRIEYGKQNATVDTLARLAEALHTPLWRLFTKPRSARRPPGRPAKRRARPPAP
jgi:transcriptional regulator with XRE-family HTH domain